MAALKENTGTFEGSGSVKIFYRHYPAGAERGRMVIAHGLGEHSGRYGHVVQWMLSLGVSVWVPDHRGHGRSEGKRGHVLNFSQYLTDLRKMVAIAKRDLPEGMKCFLLGHSLGGLIALYFGQRFAALVDGMVVSSPALGMVSEIPAVKKGLGLMMSYVWPSLSMGNELDASKISHDPTLVAAYESDPLVHDRVSARFFTEFLAAIQTVQQEASTVKMPILFQVAGDDHLVNAQSSKQFFERVTAADKTLRVYEGMYHEIYNETAERRHKALQDLAEWLAQHLT